MGGLAGLDRDEIMYVRRTTSAGAAGEELPICRGSAQPDSPALRAVDKDCFGDALPERLGLQPDGSEFCLPELPSKVDLCCLDRETEAGSPA